MTKQTKPDKQAREIQALRKRVKAMEKHFELAERLEIVRSKAVHMPHDEIRKLEEDVARKEAEVRRLITKYYPE